MDASTKRLVRRNSILLSGGQAASYVPIQVTSLIGSIAVFQLSGDVALAGLVYSISWIGRVIVSYASGWMMDRFGRKLILTIGGLVTMISMIAAGFLFITKDIPGIMGAFLLYGVGGAMFAQNRIAMTDMYDDSGMGTAVGYLYTASIFGSFISIPVAMLVEPISGLTGINQYSLLWFAAAIACLLSVVTTVLLKPDTREIAARLKVNRPKDAEIGTRNGSSPLKNPSVIVAFVVSALTWGVMITMMSLLSLHMSAAGMSLTLITTTISLHIMGMYILSLPFGKLVDRFGAKKFVILGSVLTGLGGLLTPLTQSYNVITLSMFLVGLGWSASNVSTTALIANATDVSIRGRVLGLSDMVTGITSTITPFVGGVVIGAEGFFGFGVYGFALSIPAILMAIAMKSDSRLVARKLL